MKNFAKFTLVALTISVLGLSSCGKKGTDETTTTTPETTTTTTTPETTTATTDTTKTTTAPAEAPKQ